jgi:hypothetical protein
MKRKTRLATLIGIPLTIFLLVIAVAFYFIYLPIFLPDHLEYLRLLNNGSRTTGVVTGVNVFQSSDTEFYHSLKYNFTSREGQLIIGRYDVSLRSIPEVGESLEIAYEPVNPNNNIPVKYVSSGNTWFYFQGLLISAVIGFLAAGLSLLCIRAITRWDF